MAGTDIIGGGNIEPRALEDEMRSAYLDYAMSVIVGRALPDVRDGLKPVHRRVLFSMSENGLGPDAPAREVRRGRRRRDGQVPPARRPAIYDTLVRMAQDFSMRYTAGRRAGQLRLDRRRPRRGHALHRGAPHAPGDGDAARPRPGHGRLHRRPTTATTRSRSSCRRASRTCWSTARPASRSAWRPTSRRTTCARSPTRSIAYIDDPQITVDELMRHVKGPDFPTGGIIVGRQGIRDAYETGRGRVRVRARVGVEEIGQGKEALIVTELPYAVKKGGDGGLITKIADLVHDKKIPDITDLRDESDRHGMRLVIELKRGALPKVVLNQLYKHTAMQSTFGVNMVALVDGIPRTLSLREVISAYVNHQREVIVRRTKFELSEKERRAHILEGLLIAIDNLDAVIELIRASRDRESARTELMDALRALAGAGDGDPRPAPVAAHRARVRRDPRRARRRRRAHQGAARDPRRRDARPGPHQGGARRDRRALRGRPAHGDHGLRGRDRHRGPDRRPADGHHDHQDRLHQVAAADDLPQAAPRRRRA